MKSLLAAVLLTLVPVKEPTLKRIRGPVYKLVNPLLYPIEASVYCGAEFQPLVIKVPAGVSEEIEIKAPDGSAGMCILSTWRKAP